jgi:serine/threonine-protein kinase
VATRESLPSKPEETETLLGATIVGRYKILSVIARGGMGKVYKAEQSALGRICAVKILSPHYEGNKDPEFHRRFSLEASTAAKLQSPHTVTIFDYGKDEEKNVYYIAMEFLEGRTLHRVLHDERTITEARANHIAQQVCRSLTEAHRHGVVHRDLKPGNIMLLDRGDDTDYVKVLDFGLVKDVTGKGEDLTQTGLFMGSPKYMAPEQVVGGEISARTDVYALGVILYEMIAGKVPFDRKQGMSTLIAHVNEAPPAITIRNPDALVSSDMEQLIMRCLEKEPEKRYASMKDLIGALKRAAGDLSETYESLPRARIDLESLKQAGAPSRPNSRLSAGPPPSISGTLMSGAPAVRPESAEGPASASGAQGSGPQGGSGPQTASGPQGSPSGSGPLLGDSLSPPQASRTFTGNAERAPAASWRPYIFAVVTSILGGGTAAVVLSRQHDGHNAQIPSAAPAAVAIAVSPSSEPPRGPGIRIIRIDSDPEGAMVSDQGVQVCMATPCEIYWRGESAKSEHKLTLTKKGFKVATVTVGADDEKALGKLEVWTPQEIAAMGGQVPPVPVPVPQPQVGKSDPAPTASASATATVAPASTPAPTTTATPAVVTATTPAPPPPETATPAPAPAPPQPQAGGVMHMEEGMTRPSRVSGGNPVYSREAIEAKSAGTVVAKCVISESGSVSSCRIIKGIPFMDGPVLAALQSWKYTPAQYQGKAVSVEMPVTLKLVPPP